MLLRDTTGDISSQLWTNHPQCDHPVPKLTSDCASPLEVTLKHRQDAPSARGPQMLREQDPGGMQVPGIT